MKTRVFSGLLLGLCLFSHPAFAANLYGNFSGKGTVKTYVAPPTDATSEKKADPEGLKSQIEKKLLERKSIAFAIAATREEADIAIDTEIKEFFWSDHDPVDMIVGIGATAMDAAIQENYSRMQAVITVTDLKARKVLWQEKVMATITSKTMTEPESVPMMSEDMAKVFVKKAFARQRK